MQFLESVAPQLPHAQQVYLQRVQESQLPAPVTGIILGTGMGGVAEEIEVSCRIPYVDLPGFSPATIAGHQGELIAGRLAGQPVVALSGRSHLYEGRTLEQIRFPVLFFYLIGVRNLIVGNASGGINPKFNSGEVMLIDDHLDLLFQVSPPVPGKPDCFSEGSSESLKTAAKSELLSRTLAGYRSGPYHRDWIDIALEIGRQHDLCLQQGVYAALTGPNYETRAEYRMLARLGADVVGMSTIPEAILAAELGMAVCGLSTITNIANPDVVQKTSHEEVIEAVSKAENSLRTLIVELVSRMS